MKNKRRGDYIPSNDNIGRNEKRGRGHRNESTFPDTCVSLQ